MDFNPSTSYAAHRALLKRVMHSFGLGLRHVRLLVESCEDLEVRDSIMRSTAVSRRLWICTRTQPRLYGPMVGCVQALARLYAAKGIRTSDLLGSWTRYCQAASTVQSSTTACIGTGLAAAGGIHQRSPVDASRSLILELAHIQKVAGTGQLGTLHDLHTLAGQSSGLDAVHIATATLWAQILLL